MYRGSEGFNYGQSSSQVEGSAANREKQVRYGEVYAEEVREPTGELDQWGQAIYGDVSRRYFRPFSRVVEGVEEVHLITKPTGSFDQTGQEVSIEEWEPVVDQSSNQAAGNKVKQASYGEVYAEKRRELVFDEMSQPIYKNVKRHFRPFSRVVEGVEEVKIVNKATGKFDWNGQHVFAQDWEPVWWGTDGMGQGNMLGDEYGHRVAMGIQEQEKREWLGRQ